ncbi:MAG: hypothetical protein WBA19_02920 [Psychroserpens sp.]
MKSFYCSIFGHHYEVSKHITYHVKEYQCSQCKSQMTTSGTGGLTILTPKFKEINSVLERIHKKRLVRMRLKSFPSIHKTALLDFTPHFL